MSIAELKKVLSEDKTMSDENKAITLKRAEASEQIAAKIKELDLKPTDIIDILIGMACGVTGGCMQPFNAIAYLLKSMSNYYDYYEVSRHAMEANVEDINS